MMKHLKYLSYVLRHKWFVTIECFKIGLYWRGLIHDMSKFLPSEWNPYVEHFYGTGRKGIKGERDKTGYYSAGDTGEYEFDFAWLLHQKRNKHHWQWWVLPKDDGSVKIFPMPYVYLMEMLCDWVGAGRAQGRKSPVSDPYAETRKWYTSNRKKIKVHDETRARIEQIIEYQP